MKIRFWAILSILAATMACQKEEEHYNETPIGEEQFYATIYKHDADTTKTVLDEDNNIRWSLGDQLIIFNKSSLGLKYQIQDSYVGETSGYFSKVVSDTPSDDFGAGMAIRHNIAYYPYSSNVKFAKSGDDYTLKVVLPSEQTYAEESFGNGAFPMAAVSEDNDVTFKNVCGGIKIQLTGTCMVASVRIDGRNYEKLSGAAEVIAYTDGSVPSIVMSDAASTSVTLNCGVGVQLNESIATEFIISLPPTQFTKGFIITVTDIDGKTQVVETSKSNDVLRSSLLVMPEISLTLSGTQEFCYIDEYGVNHGPGIKIGETVWAPVNCGYHKDNFKYGKYYQWGRIHGQGYFAGFDNDGSISADSDAIIPIIIEKQGRATLDEGQSEKYKNVIFSNTATSYDYSDYYERWWGPRSNDLWPQYNPCPEGWRPPTDTQLNELLNSGCVDGENDLGVKGRWFSNSKLFLPYAGYTDVRGWGINRTSYGHYWSTSCNGYRAYQLSISKSNAAMSLCERVYGQSIRCIKK